MLLCEIARLFASIGDSSMILVQPQLLLLIKLVRIVDLVSHNRVERLLPLAEPARQLLLCILAPHRQLAVVGEEYAEVVIVAQFLMVDNAHQEGLVHGDSLFKQCQILALELTLEMIFFLLAHVSLSLFNPRKARARLLEIGSIWFWRNQKSLVKLILGQGRVKPNEIGIGANHFELAIVTADF